MRRCDRLIGILLLLLLSSLCACSAATTFREPGVTLSVATPPSNIKIFLPGEALPKDAVLVGTFTVVKEGDFEDCMTMASEKAAELGGNAMAIETAEIEYGQWKVARKIIGKALVIPR